MLTYAIVVLYCIGKGKHNQSYKQPFWLIIFLVLILIKKNTIRIRQNNRAMADRTTILSF